MGGKGVEMSRHAARLWRAMVHEGEEQSSGRYARAMFWRDELCREVAVVLRGSPQVECLTMNRAVVSVGGWESLAAGVGACTSLQELRLRSVSVVEGPCPMIGALKQNSSIRTLVLSGLSLGHEGCEEMALSLGGSVSLQSLRIRGPSSETGDSFDLCHALGSALQQSRSLRDLRIEPTLEGAIDGAGCEELARGLSDNCPLVTLKLSENSIGTKGAIALGEALQYGSFLTLLDLGGNNIQDEGCAALCCFLSTTSVLQKLGLDRNEITCVGCEYLVEALLDNSSVTEIDLFSNIIASIGWASLSTLLCQPSCSLSSLNLEFNQIDTSCT